MGLAAYIVTNENFSVFSHSWYETTDAYIFIDLFQKLTMAMR